MNVPAFGRGGGHANSIEWQLACRAHGAAGGPQRLPTGTDNDNNDTSTRRGLTMQPAGLVKGRGLREPGVAWGRTRPAGDTGRNGGPAARVLHRDGIRRSAS